MTVLAEGTHAGEFLVAEANGDRSRETITIASGQNLTAGHVLGQQVDGGNITTAADGGNTGDGTIAMEATPVGAGVRPGDYRAVCIEPATAGGIFGVYDPDGVNIGAAEVGSAFSGPVAFTISDGATDFVAGDAFTISVPEGSWVEYDPSDAKGADLARGVLFDAVDATGGAKTGVAIVRDAVVKASALQWFDGATSGQKTTGEAELARQEIIAR